MPRDRGGGATQESADSLPERRMLTHNSSPTRAIKARWKKARGNRIGALTRTAPNTLGNTDPRSHQPVEGRGGYVFTFHRQRTHRGGRSRNIAASGARTGWAPRSAAAGLLRRPPGSRRPRPDDNETGTQRVTAHAAPFASGKKRFLFRRLWRILPVLKQLGDWT